MILRLSRFGSVSFLPLLVTSLLVCDAPAADTQHGRPIEFSDPKNADVSTNLSQVGAKRGGLRDLEDDLTKSFQSRFSSGGSLDGVYAPPPGWHPAPAISIKKLKEAKEAIDRKRNWFLGSPEDFLNGPSLAETLGVREYGPDGKEKKQLSAVEAYYERQERQLNGGIDPRDRDKDRDRDRGSERDRDELAGAKKHPGLPDDSEDSEEKDKADRLTEKNQMERELRGLFDAHPLDSAFMTETLRSTPTDIFGLGIKPLSTEQIEAAKNSTKQYGEFLNSFTMPAPAAVAPSSLSGILDFQAPAPINAFESPPALSRSGAFDSSPGMLSSTFGLPDGGIKGLGSLDSASVVPKAEPLKLAPPSAAFDVPRRKF